MANIFASGNGLTLIGVIVLALATVIVAVWTARTSSRTAKLHAQVEALEKRLGHVEEYLSSSSRMSVLDDGDDDEDEPMERSGGRTRGGSGSRAANRERATGRSNDRQASKTRRSKRDMVVPSGAAKSAARPTARTPQPRAEDPFSSRQSMSHDARRRREERHQAQMRQRAQAIVQEHNRQYGGGSETEEL